MAADITRLPDCPECGQPRFRLVMCGCGHPAVIHDLNKAGERTRCDAASGPTGVPCGCRRFVEVSGGETA